MDRRQAGYKARRKGKGMLTSKEAGQDRMIVQKGREARKQGGHHIIAQQSGFQCIL